MLCGSYPRRHHAPLRRNPSIAAPAPAIISSVSAICPAISVLSVRPPLDASRHLARARLHALAHFRTRKLQRWPQPEDDPRQHRHHDGESKHGKIDMDGGFMRKRVRRQQRHNLGQRSGTPAPAPAPPPSARAAAIPSEAAMTIRRRPAPIADAHRKLLLPRRRPRQQQNRHVPASDQQQQRHRAKTAGKACLPAA